MTPKSTLVRTLARIPLAPVIAVMFGLAAAALVALTPQWRFESLIASSGLGDLLSVARPPLGMKARLLAIVAAFVLVAGALYLVTRAVALLGQRVRRPRRAPTDDALDLAAFLAPETIVPTRKPIFADRDLGAPLMSDEALGQGIDEPPVRTPGFFAPEPVVPVDATDSLDAPLRIEEFDVAQPGVEAESSGVEERDDSIAALVARLEAGLARRTGPQGPRPGGGVLRDGPPELSPPELSPPELSLPGLSLVASPLRDDDAATSMALRTLKRMARR